MNEYIDIRGVWPLYVNGQQTTSITNEAIDLLPARIGELPEDHAQRIAWIKTNPRRISIEDARAIVAQVEASEPPAFHITKDRAAN